MEHQVSVLNDNVFCSLSASAPESSSDEASASKHVDLPDDQVLNSGSNSPASGAVPEHQFLVTKESSSPQNLDSYAEIGLVHSNSTSYPPSESQQQIDTPELQNFSVSQVLAVAELYL